MNNVKEKIAVMQAFANGEQIECQSRERGGNWTSTPDPWWDWAAFTYRVKPKPPVPEVRYVNEYRDGSGYATKTEQATRTLGVVNVSRLAVKYIEVTPEVAAALAKEGIKY